MDIHELALDLAAVSYFEHSGGVDPALLDAPNTDNDCIFLFFRTMKHLLTVVALVSALCPLIRSTFSISCPLAFHLWVTPSFHELNDVPDSPLSALCGLEQILRSLDVSRSAYYDRLHVLEPALGPDATVHPHMDGGSQATTCPHADLLWHL